MYAECAGKTDTQEWDIAYIQKSFPQAVFKEFSNVGHGGLAALQPELLVSEIGLVTEVGKEI